MTRLKMIFALLLMVLGMSVLGASSAHAVAPTMFKVEQYGFGNVWQCGYVNADKLLCVRTAGDNYVGNKSKGCSHYYYTASNLVWTNDPNRCNDDGDHLAYVLSTAEGKSQVPAYSSVSSGFNSMTAGQGANDATWWATNQCNSYGECLQVDSPVLINDPNISPSYSRIYFVTTYAQDSGGTIWQSDHEVVVLRPVNAPVNVQYKLVAKHTDVTGVYGGV